MDIATLRKMRSADFGKISQEFEKTANPSSGKDDRFWKLDPDKAGNATAVIRFLPRTIKVVDGVEKSDDLPWVRVFNHGFQGPTTGKWYIENCLSTIGEDCPVCQLNSRHWNSGIESDKEIARKQKRKLSYIANIYVVSDPKHPENEGQVKLFKFGKKIYDKIMDKARPTFEDEEPVNVFDFWEGADFKLRQRKVEGYPNYDQSVFQEKSALLDGDEEEILKVANQQYILAEFVDRKEFKSYEELARKMNSVLSGSSAPSRSAESLVSDDSPAETKQRKVVDTTEDDDDGDALAYFKQIAKGDIDEDDIPF